MYIPDVIPEEDRKVILEKYRINNKSTSKFGKKPALLIIDMTRGFVSDEFPTGFSKTGVPCAKNIKLLLNQCRKLGVPVVYTKDITAPDEVYEIHRGSWNNKSSPLSREKRTEHNTIYGELEPAESEIVLEKSKPSAFFGTPLISILNYLSVDTVIITGMVTSGCIRATVIDAFSYNYNVIVPEECVADRSQISHKVTLFDLDTKYAGIMKLDEVFPLLVQAVESNRKLNGS